MSSLETPQTLPMQLPPLPEIRRLAEVLHPTDPRLILDAGSGSARHAQFLAQQGHMVIALERDFAEASDAKLLQPSIPENGKCLFVVGDVLRPMFSSLFDIVLCNEVLHMMSKTASNKILDNLRGLTRQGGLNAVSGYLLQADTGNLKNRERCFQPDELRNNYEQAGWQILDYREFYQPLQMRGSQEIVSSRATIFAQRPWLKQ